jgi:aerobic C4-dicarboxylate transport protein
VIDAFAKGDLLQVLLFSVLFAWAVLAMGEKGKPIVKGIDSVLHAFFGIVALIMKLAPIGAFGAMAFSIGKYGIGSMVNLFYLVFLFYATCAVFVMGLGVILRFYAGVPLGKYLSYIKEEILIVLGTCSSETVLPRMIDKLTHLGCSRPVVGLVVPTGYSFNLDGTAIYFTLAALFLAQATNTPLGLVEQLTILGVLLISSKGAAAVFGSAFIILTGTLTTVGHIPVVSVVLLLGIDRFMAQGRAITNLIGNGIATIIVARWENQFDAVQAREVLDGKRDPELET